MTPPRLSSADETPPTLTVVVGSPDARQRVALAIAVTAALAQRDKNSSQEAPIERRWTYHRPTGLVAVSRSTNSWFAG